MAKRQRSLRVTLEINGQDYIVKAERQPDGWAFRVYKLSKDKTKIEKIYEVMRDGNALVCNCLGFQGFGYCKHRDGVLALIKMLTLVVAPEVLHVPGNNDGQAQREDHQIKEEVGAGVGHVGGVC